MALQDPLDFQALSAFVYFRFVCKPPSLSSAVIYTLYFAAPLGGMYLAEAGIFHLQVTDHHPPHPPEGRGDP